MASPKSGKAGSAVAPAEPGEALEADDADPGKVAEAKAAQKAEGTGKYGLTPLKPHKAQTADPHKTSWIEIKLVGEDGMPISGESYEINLPDGSVASGTLDSSGAARVEGFEPGECKISFPDVDAEAWEPA